MASNGSMSRTFRVGMGRTGTWSEAFSPDFYLPQQDLYIRLTTLRLLSTKKNRKLRRLQALSDTNVKLFKRRGDATWMVKFGLFEQAEKIVSTEAQNNGS
jgi:hypoxanthine phosphoribosyltransferase